MKTAKMTSLSVLMLVACCLHPWPHVHAAPRAQSRDTGRVVGVVLDANDARIAGARIRVASGRFVREARTGDEGGFAIEVPAGTYQLTVERAGFRGFRLWSLRVPARGHRMVRVRLREQEPQGPLKLAGQLYLRGFG